MKLWLLYTINSIKNVSNDSNSLLYHNPFVIFDSALDSALDSAPLT